jgi:transaldolase
MNPTKSLTQLGQSLWLDYIRRDLLNNGEFEGLMREDGISGVTSNPAIFQKAIAESDDYNDAIDDLAQSGELPAEALYEQLAIEDVRRAADLLRPVYDQSNGLDGYVSLEVSPRLAKDTQGTLAAARRLWQTVERANLMIKVPATPQGLPAIETLIAEGINVNITLLFSVPVYEQVVEAYLSGLERRLAAGQALQATASVASFFLSRIDSAVDPQIEAQLDRPTQPLPQSEADSLLGNTAIASARLAYQRYKALFATPRWQKLSAAGARPQRLLWASTSSKNPAYDDLLYVESLIGPQTVNTLPPKTLDALRDHGRPHLSLDRDETESLARLQQLALLGIDLSQVTDELLEQGLTKFERAYTGLLESVGQAMASARGSSREMHKA